MSHHCDLADTASLFFFLFAWHSLMIMHHHTRFDYKRFSRPEDTMVIIILIQCCKKLWPCSSVNQQEQNHKSAKQTYNSIQTFHTHPPTLWLYTHAHYNYTHTHIHSLTHKAKQKFRWIVLLLYLFSPHSFQWLISTQRASTVWTFVLVQHSSSTGRRVKLTTGSNAQQTWHSSCQNDAFEAHNYLLSDIFKYTQILKSKF